MTNIGLSNRTGTEIVIRDLARAFRAAGHFPMVYAPVLGAVAEEIAGSGIPVVSNLKALPWRPDVIHGHHHLETIEAVQGFPGVPALFVCHDRIAWHDEPPLHPQIFQYVAVDENCRERLAEQSGLAKDRVAVILNAVDESRFLPRPPLPERPRRALVFSNYAGRGTHLEAVSAACRQIGAALDVAGSGAGNQTDAPEALLGRYDLVFAKGRCALEALSVGCSVVLCDTRGLGPLVTSSEVATLRPWNFGMRLLRLPLEPAEIVRQIERYDPQDAAKVCAYIRCRAKLSSAASRYVALYWKMLGQAERRLWSTGDASRYPHTEPLQVSDQGLLSIRIPRAPGTVPPGEDFFLQAVLESRTRLALATAPPLPAFLLYRWFSPETGEAVVPMGTRSLVQPPLLPGQTRSYPVRVVPPKQPGDYNLRITLMQEGWRYLDELSPRLFAEVRISVGAGAPGRAG